MIPKQLTELRKLAFGAMEHYYFRDLHDACDYLIQGFSKWWPEESPKNLPVPFCYPMGDDRIMMLWINYPSLISYEFCFIDKSGYLRTADLRNDNTKTELIYLREDQDWVDLVERIVDQNNAEQGEE